jgi:hypothetical protein
METTTRNKLRRRTIDDAAGAITGVEKITIQLCGSESNGEDLR